MPTASVTTRKQLLGLAWNINLWHAYDLSNAWTPGRSLVLIHAADIRLRPTLVILDLKRAVLQGRVGAKQHEDGPHAGGSTNLHERSGTHPLANTAEGKAPAKVAGEVNSLPRQQNRALRHPQLPQTTRALLVNMGPALLFCRACHKN